MDIRQLRYFTVVARERNISKAAEHLHITQPALSRQIHALEQRLGVTLIERFGRGIRLTLAAEELLPRRAELIARASGLEDLAAELSGGKQSVIRFGATPHFIESLVAKVLRTFRSIHPGVEVVFTERTSGELGGLLDHNEIHLALGAYRAVGAYPTRLLPAVALMVVAPRRHRFESRDTVELHEIVEEPLLLLRRGFLTREVFESACQLAQLMPSVRHESESVHTLLALVEAEFGVAIVQSNARIPRQAVRLMQDGKPLCAELAAAWNPHAHLPPSTIDLIDAVERVMQKIGR